MDPISPTAPAAPTPAAGSADGLTQAQTQTDKTIANLAKFAEMSAKLSNATTGFQFMIKADEAQSQAATSVKNATRIS